MANHTLYQRRVRAARMKIERDMAHAIYDELSTLWRTVYPRVRRLSNQRPATKAARRVALRKASFITDTRLWEAFEERLRNRLISELVTGAVKLEQIHRAHRDREEITIDPQMVVEASQTEIADEVRGITYRTRRKIGRAVSEWYQAPENTLDDLVEDLRPSFSEARAQTIAITETTWLNSRVTLAEMDALGTDDWIWDTARDEIVCRACREKHGRTFHRGDPMPPAGSHPSCRCTPIPVPKTT